MTQDYRTGFPIDRRTVLRGLGAAGVGSIVGVSATTGSVAANSHITETIYLSHSVDSEHVTKLYTVDLDSTPGAAVLALVTSIGAPFENVDAIAGTPDGAKVMFVDRNTAHLGEYDVAGDSFTDLGQITGLPTVTVLAAYGLDGKLYAASNTTNKLYTIDDSVTPPVANEIGLITGATVDGADIVFDSTDTLFLHSNADDTLYTVDYKNVVGGNVAATLVGTASGASLTGLAVRGAGTGNLVGSSRADDAIVVLDKTDGSRDATYPMKLNGVDYSYTNGDMATGVIIDETCTDCTSGDMLAKYEFTCIDWDAEGDCVDWDFVLEGDGDSNIAYTAKSFTWKPDEMYEPMSVTFETEYCDLYALVKSGQEFEVQSFADNGGSVTVETANEKYAISFVAFYCTEAAAQAALEAFPSRGKGNPHDE